MKRMRTRNRRIATLGLIVLLSAGLSLDNMLKDRQKIKKEIVFIAPNLKNKNIIADELAGDATVVYLSGDTRGLEQIAAYLKTQRDIETVRIFSHGDDGLLDLPGLPLSSENIVAFTDELLGWKEALATDADILLYGCNVAATEKGQHFVKQLAQLTGADVAASTNRSGGTENEWALEFASGNIEAENLGINDYPHYLETYVVTDNTGSGENTLRWAIQQSNDSPDVDDIIVFDLASGNTVILDIELPFITDQVQIGNVGGTHTIIERSSSAETFEIMAINANGETITLDNLTFTGGVAPSRGGGINLLAGALNINNSFITGNSAVQDGGGFAISGDCIVNINNTTISENHSDFPGGGIAILAGTLTINNSKISGNTSSYYGGGISASLYAATTIINSTISGNTANTKGGGIFNKYSTLTIQNSTISGNSVSNASEAVKGGGIFSSGRENYTVVISSTISGNTATSENDMARGGGIFSESNFHLENSTISGNTATSGDDMAQGGGLYSKTEYSIFNFGDYGTSITLKNCTISKNGVNSSVSGNAQGAGVFLTSTDGTTDQIRNSIIAQNNNNTENYDLYTDDHFYGDMGYNVVEYCNRINYAEPTSILYNKRSTDPEASFTSWSQGGVELENQTLGLASTLADNGGPTQTHALAEGSFAAASPSLGIPAANNWNNSPEINEQYTDQRGVVRVAGRNTSIGAYSQNYEILNNVWTGSTNTSWDDVSNWSLNSVPDKNMRAEIENADNDPIISTSVECCELSIDVVASLRIAPTGTLKVYGTLDNNNGTAGLILESNNSGTGKLVNNTDGVQATVRQYIVKDQWHYVSSPISDLIDVNTVFNRFYVIKNDETKGLDGSWVYLEQGEGMEPGLGYGVMWNRSHKPEEGGYTDKTVSFAGTLNTGDIYPLMSYSDVDRGWNFMGNPYPCTIDWEVLKTRTEHIYDAIYVWNPMLSGENKYGSYGAYVGEVAVNGQTQYIAPMQGFFIKSENTAADYLYFFNDVKTTETSTFKSATVQSILRLALSDALGATDESVIRIHPAATETFDGKLDAYKLKANSLTPQLYSVLNGDEYSINSLPEVSEQTVVPFELMIRTSGRHTLALSELNGYNKALPIILFNQEGQLLADLQSGAYTFTAQAGEVVKVKLAFSNVHASAKTRSNPFLRVAVDGNMLNLSGLGQGKSTVKLFNTSGQLLQNHQTHGDVLQIPNLNRGVYLLRVKDSYGMQQVKKVVIQ